MHETRCWCWSLAQEARDRRGGEGGSVRGGGQGVEGGERWRAVGLLAGCLVGLVFGLVLGVAFRALFGGVLGIHMVPEVYDLWERARKPTQSCLARERCLNHVPRIS